MAVYTGEIEYKVPEIELEPQEPSFGEKAGAFAYGAGTGLVGGLGELEHFGAYTVPEMLGAREPGTRDKFLGRETLFPTVKDAQSMASGLGIKPPREEVSGYQTAGEIAGGLGTSVPGLVKGGVRALVGSPSKTSEALAKKAEQLGFKLSPTQVRQDVPTPSKGALFYEKENQSLANKLASEGTGKEAREIDRTFIGKRLDTLGKDFNDLYKGKVFNIDEDAVNAIQEISAREQQLPGVATTSAVKQTADNILRNFSALASRPGAKPETFGINGEALQTLRNALTSRARGSSAGDAREIYNLIDVVDASIERNHPEIASELESLRPKYRNSIILEDLYKRGGIQQGNISLQKLGEMLRNDRGTVRRTQKDIDELAELGRELQIRARFEKEGSRAGEATDSLSKALGLGLDVLGAPTRSRYVGRPLQRMLPPEKPVQFGPTRFAPTAKKIPAATAAGTLTRPFKTEEQ
jgi:hypothetical protein